MAESIKITGVADVQKALYSYSQKLGDFVVYKALREGANYMKKRVAALAPVYTGKARIGVKSGTLKRGFKVSKSRIHNGRFSDSLIGVYLTLRKGKGKNDPNDPFYGRWQELGWNTRGRNSVGRRAITSVFGSRTGRKSGVGKSNIPGKFFMAKAFDQSKNTASDLIIRSSIEGAQVLANKVGF